MRKYLLNTVQYVTFSGYCKYRSFCNMLIVLVRMYMNLADVCILEYEHLTLNIVCSVQCTPTFNMHSSNSNINKRE